MVALSKASHEAWMEVQGIPSIAVTPLQWFSLKHGMSWESHLKNFKVMFKSGVYVMMKSGLQF